MDIKVRTNISKEFNDIEIDINAPEKNEEVQRIENYLLTETAKSINTILGMQDNNIFIIDTQEIITVFGEGKTNYCKTKNGRYRSIFIKLNIRKAFYICRKLFLCQLS